MIKGKWVKHKHKNKVKNLKKKKFSCTKILHVIDPSNHSVFLPIQTFVFPHGIRFLHIWVFIVVDWHPCTSHSDAKGNLLHQYVTTKPWQSIIICCSRNENVLTGPHWHSLIPCLLGPQKFHPRNLPVKVDCNTRQSKSTIFSSSVLQALR